MEMTLIGPSLVPLGRLDWLSCSWVSKWNAAGSWTAQVDGADPVANRIVPGCRVFVRDSESGSFSGLITSIERSRTSKGVTNLNLTGIDELASLRYRLTYPNPDRAVDDQNVGYYTDAGPVSPVVSSLVLRNMGAAALPSRRWAGLVVDEPVTGKNATVKTRFNSLLDEVGTLATVAGVKNTCVYDTDRQIHFRCRATTDRTRSMVLRQEAGTLGEWQVSLTAPEATAFIVAGQGEGAARAIRTYGIASADTWGFRVESFKDQRDAATTAELDKAGADLVANTAGSAAVTLTVQERMKVFGRDYQLGDTVTANLDGVPYTDRLQTAQIDWSEKGRTVALTIGKGEDQDNAAPGWVRKIRPLAESLRRLEVR